MMAQELLEGIGRSHGISDVRAALAAVAEVSPQSWSLDLMSGLPHLTMDLWKDSLQAAVEARPSHISVYDLQVRMPPPMVSSPTDDGANPPLLQAPADGAISLRDSSMALLYD